MLALVAHGTRKETLTMSEAKQQLRKRGKRRKEIATRVVNFPRDAMPLIYAQLAVIDAHEQACAARDLLAADSMSKQTHSRYSSTKSTPDWRAVL